MRRIVIDARSVRAKRSGIGNYVQALVAAALPIAGDVELVLLRHPDERKPLTNDPRVTEMYYPGETKSVKTVFGLGIRRRFDGCDLYHSPADLVPLGLRIPYVVTIHDLMWVEARPLASGFLPVRLANGLWYTVNIARAIRGARRVIAISDATRNSIARIYPEHAHKVRVVRHGVDHEVFAAEHAKQRSALSAIVPEGVQYSLCVGQGSPYKNHARMIRAFVRATVDDSEHKLVLVRRFSRVDAEMRALLSRPEVRRAVIVVPHVDMETLITLYRHARMLLFVSLYEGFGMPAVEAMNIGTPVLGSTAEAVAEVAGSAALLADPRDELDIAEKIRVLHQDEALRRRLIDAGYVRARSFRWSEAARQTLDVYREAIDP